MPDRRGSRTRSRGSSSTWPRASGTRAARARGPSPRPWDVATSGCHAADSITRRTCGDTTAPGSGLNPARSSASYGGSGTETRSSCSTRWTRPGPRPPRCSSKYSIRNSRAVSPDRSSSSRSTRRRSSSSRPPTSGPDPASPAGPPRDRRVAGLTETERVGIARTHLVPAENRAASLASTPVRITDGALRKLIRDYTCKPGIRQLTRCIKTICRKVALGRETGDRTLDRRRVTARDVGR